MEKLRIFEGFSGIGAVSKSIERLGIPHELVGFSEIDPFAPKSFSAIHGVEESLNYGDVCKIDEKELPDFDLYTFGSPCQDFSVAGKQAGATWTCAECGHQYNPLEVHYSTREACPQCGSNSIEKTRSSLVVEALRIIRHKKPKYLLMENVKNLVGKVFKNSFDLILQELDEYGYNSYWDVLNSKKFGVPQNRERVFVVSVRKDIDNGNFIFPKGFDNGVRLKDILEKEVEKKYYIDNERSDKLLYQLIEKASTSKTILVKKQAREYSRDIDTANTLLARDWKGYGNQEMVAVIEPKRLGGMFDEEGKRHQAGSVWDKETIAPTLDTMQGGLRQPCIITSDDPSEYVHIKQATKKGYAECKLGGLADLSYPSSTTRRGRVQDEGDTCPTICAAQHDICRIETAYRIRRLTPLECFILMGFTREDYMKIKAIKISDTQAYKQAGNSIVVDVLCYIFLELFKGVYDMSSFTE